MMLFSGACSSSSFDYCSVPTGFKEMDFQDPFKMFFKIKHRNRFTCSLLENFFTRV